MNFSKGPSEQPEFQMAPMIDIVFLLLVFFLATYAMAQMERELTVTVPKADAADDAVARVNELVVNISATGGLIVNQQGMTLEGLRERLRRLSEYGGLPGVIIRADENCPHKFVVAAMGVCRDMQAPHIFVSALTAEKGAR